jgi:SAM-dependent methyltransferase
MAEESGTQRADCLSGTGVKPVRQVAAGGSSCWRAAFGTCRIPASRRNAFRGRHGRDLSGTRARRSEKRLRNWVAFTDSRPVPATFEQLLAEGAAAPVVGWGFSWFDGRATEQRPSWGYSRILAERMSHAAAALDFQTGGGEVLAEIPNPPPVLVATESWPPNVAVAAGNLRPLGAALIVASGEAALPFRTGSFDLVVSRHPISTPWQEIARVMRPGGTFLSQQIGAGQQRELSRALMGSLPPPSSKRRPDVAAASAAAAGLVVTDLRHEVLRTVFYDIAAVVCFLRKVVWTVPDFTVDRYRDRLAQLHEHIQANGSFVSHAHRFLIEAHKPTSHAVTIGRLRR